MSLIVSERSKTNPKRGHTIKKKKVCAVETNTLMQITFLLFRKFKWVPLQDLNVFIASRSSQSGLTHWPLGYFNDILDE